MQTRRDAPRLHDKERGGAAQAGGECVGMDVYRSLGFTVQLLSSSPRGAVATDAIEAFVATRRDEAELASADSCFPKKAVSSSCEVSFCKF